MKACIASCLLPASPFLSMCASDEMNEGTIRLIKSSTCLRRYKDLRNVYDEVRVTFTFSFRTQPRPTIHTRIQLRWNSVRSFHESIVPALPNIHQRFLARVNGTTTSNSIYEKARRSAF
ncbi:hypothetical protein BDN72DRAFT_11260 [Pluteus cervinus]|uniref:Uncharacterized protein n=1 Tax=Pluteus cervinus TaxID=181527 RepID=A0ACD3BID5_9AGAR|nr:hypothetical protein BDN72DRAFT_11260 [Pluteus cervinus]